jgi:hypothetical protein
MDDIRLRKLVVVVNFVFRFCPVFIIMDLASNHTPFWSLEFSRSLIDFGENGRTLSDVHVSQLIKVGTVDENLYFL